MAVTQEDIKTILAAIRAESQSVDDLESVSTLEGVVSLPALLDNQVVSVPIALLSAIAEAAASKAESAATSANAASAKANAAADKAVLDVTQVQADIKDVAKNLGAYMLKVTFDDAVKNIEANTDALVQSTAEKIQTWIDAEKQERTTADATLDSRTETLETYRTTARRQIATLRTDLDKTASSLASFQASLRPTRLDVEYPPHLTSTNRVIHYITPHLYYTLNGVQTESPRPNVLIYVCDGDALSVFPDGRIKINGEGDVSVAVVPTDNTELAQVLTISITAPGLARISDGTIRVASSGDLILQ